MKRHGRILMMAGLSIGLWGCGLSEYEKRMDEQRGLLRAFDEENKLLGPPLELSPMVVPGAAPLEKKEKKEGPAGFPVRFFLRPPREISNFLRENYGPFVFDQVALYRYSSNQKDSAFRNLLVATAKQAGPNSTAKDELAPKEFRRQVRKALEEFYDKVEKKSMTWKGDAKNVYKDMVNYRGEKTTRAYFAQTYPENADPKEPVEFYLFFFQQVDGQAAVIYHMDPEKSIGIMAIQPLDASLHTLAVGEEANKRSGEYRMRGRGPR